MRLYGMLLLLTAIQALRAVETITVFAAASAGDVITAVSTRYQERHDILIVTSVASSATLARQIDQGAPADVFLSADEPWMDWLSERGCIKTGSRADLFANELVIVCPLGGKFPLTVDKSFDFSGAFTGRLAIADPGGVPAGIYAKEALNALGWWMPLEYRLAPAADVRAALKLVEIGETEAGVVYATDAKASKKVEIVAPIPGNLHAPIRYPIALTATAKAAAAEFLDFLRSPEAEATYRQAGFLPLKAADGAVH